MKRRTFDAILTLVGLGITVFLIVAGSLGLWAYNFANSNVHNQLVQQGIVFPPAAAFQNAKVGTEITTLRDLPMDSRCSSTGPRKAPPATETKPCSARQYLFRVSRPRPSGWSRRKTVT